MCPGSPWGLVLPPGPNISPRGLLVPCPVAGEVAGVLPLALFNLPASPPCSPVVPVTSPSVTPLGPGRATPALCSGEGKIEILLEGEAGTDPCLPTAFSSCLPEPILHCGTNVAVAVSWLCSAGLDLSLISDCN